MRCRRATHRGAVETLALASALLGALAVATAAGESAPRHGGTATGQHAPAFEADLDARLQGIVVLIYQSRLSEAQRVADAALAVAPQDPRVHLLEARILRESFPDQSTTGENLEGFSAPIHAELERTMQLCDTLLAREDCRAAAYLYRGWAHLFAAQMHTLCDEMWSAGRDAKHGKEDLDHALALDPGNTDGQGILGTYLYFADVLPRVIKLARTLAGIPGGDKHRGLEMMHASAAGAGYNRLDAQALLGAIAVGFEGDYAGGRRILEGMLREFPDSPRLVEPLAVLDLFEPERAQMERTRRVARAFAANPVDWYRQLSQRLTFYQSLQELVLGRVDDALEHMEEIHKSGPTQPDWFPNDVVICAVEMHALIGERAPAQVPAAGGRNAPQLAKLLRALQQPQAVATPEQAATFRRAQEAARGLYAADPSGARRLLDALGTIDDPAEHFYRGELARLSGETPQAIQQYQRLTEQPLPMRWRLYKTLAFSRLAEIRGATSPATAEELLGRAVTFDEDRDLFRHLLRSRRRYYDLIANGDERPAAAGGNRAPTEIR
jgi:hypothetical protein